MPSVSLSLSIPISTYIYTYISSIYCIYISILISIYYTSLSISVSIYIYILISCYGPSWLPVLCVCVYIYMYIYIIAVPLRICYLFTYVSSFLLSPLLVYKIWMVNLLTRLDMDCIHIHLFLAEWRQNTLIIKSDRNSQLIASMFQK